MLRHVLFIGNSHTYFNYMPQMFLTLVNSKDQGFKLAVDQCTGEGADLVWHWKNSATRNAIRERSWDYVVLQDRSGGPLEEPDSFITHAGLLNEEIQKQGAKTILFLTWANRSRPETQAVLTHIYKTAAQKLNAELAPVGLAWEKIQQLDPRIELYHQDSRHANPTGSYLSACVFYSLMLNTSPQGLPGSFNYKGRVWVDLDKGRASLLQKVAWNTISTLHTL